MIHDVIDVIIDADALTGDTENNIACVESFFATFGNKLHATTSLTRRHVLKVMSFVTGLI